MLFKHSKNIKKNKTVEKNSNINIQKLSAEIGKVIKGKQKQIDLVITCLLAGGHILMEDNPGTGKTMLAKSLAHAISGSKDQQDIVFKRIQFTPDLLPMDLLGSHIYNDQSNEFVFKKGPLFSNILLADEINRASPKVQSALLECMAENQITIGDTSYKLSELFFTIATQNPIEMEGTYPLPSAQLDRFYMKINFGYVDADVEFNILKNYQTIADNFGEIQQVLSLDDIIALRQVANQVYIHDEIIQSVSHIIRNTRNHKDITLGASTRSGIAFIKCLKAYALVQNRNYVTEDDIKDLSHFVLDHRLIYLNKEGKASALKQLINTEIERLTKLKISIS